MTEPTKDQIIKEQGERIKYLESDRNMLKFQRDSSNDRIKELEKKDDKITGLKGVIKDMQEAYDEKEIQLSALAQANNDLKEVLMILAHRWETQDKRCVTTSSYKIVRDALDNLEKESE